ncbi:MAG TPA: hypothetical protein DEQ38_11375 [Elusimicrobia bacterium]|nr:MAG: hypothetical protein A2089_14100 [Elusimicrobia bacterium GWD2_63_28]HCC48698.1 hypothetical protein [Elusimicrobiota bacterium]
MKHTSVTDLSRLKKRLAAVFILTASGLVAGGVWYYANFRASREAAAEQLLLSIQQIKLDQLRHWREERLGDAMALADNPVLGIYLSRFAADTSDRAAAGLLGKRLQAYLRHKKYPFAAIADASGKVLVYAGTEPEAMCPQLTTLIPKGRGSGGPEMGEFFRAAGENHPHIDIIAPAFKGGRGRELFLVLRVDPADFLYPLLQTWSASGESGETLLVGREGDEVVFLNDLRHVRDAALNLRIPITRDRLPSAMALNGYKGLLRGKDYRGIEVLAAVAPVPGASWAIVTKLDWDEVMKGTARVGILLALLALSLLACVGAVIFLLFRMHAEKTTEMLARLTDQVPGVVYQYRLYPDGRSCFPYASSGMSQIYGVTPEQVREDATPVFGRLHPDDLKATSEAIFKSARALSLFHWEFRVVLPEQGLGWRMCDARPERLPDGGTLWHGVISDITGRKRSEEIVSKLNRDLSEKNREMENLLYITSHDLRSPLVNIQGFGQSLEEYFAVIKKSQAGGGEEVRRLLEEKVPAALGFISGSAAKMDSLITALLRLSRLGRAQPQPQRVDMNRLMRQILSYFSFRAEKEGAVLTCGDLPPCLADREALNQVFSNLVENALKYRHPDRPPRVEISGRVEAGMAVYEVRDNGLGIEAAKADKIWKLFYRVNPSASAEGEGVGLALVKALTEKNGGSAGVASEPGQGSIFRLEFPAAQGVL